MRLGLRRQLQIKVVEGFDFYPVEGGFRVMHERKEFERGPNADHVASVFHVLQGTGNERLAPTIRLALADGRVKAAKAEVTRQVERLERGAPIEGGLSRGQYDAPYADFTREDIQRPVRAGHGASSSPNKEDSDGKLATETHLEAHVGAGPR